MKVQIRNNMFETNSSSAHALLIMKKQSIMTQQEIRREFWLDEDWHKNKGNVLRLDSYKNEFGREFDVLTSFRDKLSYALASMYGNCYRLKSYIEAGNSFKEIYVPLLKRLVGVNDVEMPLNSVSFNVYSDSVTDDLEQDYTTYEEVPYEDLVRNEEWGSGSEDEDYYKEVCKSGRKQEKIWLEMPEFGGVDHQSTGLFQRFLEKYNITLEDYLIRKDIIVIIDGDECCIFNTMIDSGIVNKDAIEVKYPQRDSYVWELYKEKHPDEYNENGEWIETDENTD